MWQIQIAGSQPPHIMTCRIEGIELVHFLIPEQDQEHSLLFGDNHLASQHCLEDGVLVSML